MRRLPEVITRNANVRRMLAVLLCVGYAAAVPGRDAPSPDVVIRDATKQMFEALRKDRKVQAGDETRAVAVIQAKGLPLIDFARFTRLAAGKYWLSASEVQKQALTHEFQILLTRTYVNQIVMMSDKQVEVRPLKALPADTEVTVKALLTQPGSPALSVEFSLWRTAQGWRIYDIAVESMSGVAAYRAIFATEIQRGGMEGLIRTLAEKNRIAATGR